MKCNGKQVLFRFIIILWTNKFLCKIHQITCGILSLEEIKSLRCKYSNGDVEEVE